MPNPPSTPPRDPYSQSSMTMRQRLLYFLIPAAITSLLLMMYFSYVNRIRAEARREQEARTAGQPLPLPGVPLNPDKPAKQPQP